MSDSVVDFDPHARALEPPYGELAKLRGSCPVAHTERGWFVSSYAGVKSVLQRTDEFTGVGGSYFDTTTFPPDELTLPNMPEPQHGRVRKLVNGALARHKTAALEPFVREIATSLLDDALRISASSGAVDVMPTFVSPIPSRVVGRALGVPVDDWEQFRRWSVELVENVWYEPPAPFSALHPEFAEYVQALIDARRAEGATGEDFISRMLSAEIEGEPVTDALVRTNAMNLIVGGNETTSSLIGHTLRELAGDPVLFEQVRADRSLVPTLIEESLRMHSPLQVLDRNIVDDAVVDGAPVRGGDRIIVALASANRDERMFEDAHRFRLDRPKPKDHVAFGAGPYVCPGAFIARLQGVTAIEVFCEKVVRCRLTDDYEYAGNPLYWSYAPYSLTMELESA